MAIPADPHRPQIKDGPHYLRDIQNFPSGDKDVQKVINEEIILAILTNPIEPHKHGGGTPIKRGIWDKRVPNSAGASGRSGGFRFTYHWDRHQNQITKLRLQLRRDANSLSSKAIEKLLGGTFR
jgi:hypothetical protein